MRSMEKMLMCDDGNSNEHIDIREIGRIFSPNTSSKPCIYPEQQNFPLTADFFPI